MADDSFWLIVGACAWLGSFVGQHIPANTLSLLHRPQVMHYNQTTCNLQGFSPIDPSDPFFVTWKEYCNETGCYLQRLSPRDPCVPYLFTKNETKHYEQENDTAAIDLHENLVAQEDSPEPKDTKPTNDMHHEKEINTAVNAS
jgi:hypothetical protein